MITPLPTIAALSLTPHASFWLALPLFPAAIGVIIYLYRAQRRLISPRIALWLTIIRSLLILLLAILFLQPALRWMHNRTSAGELWVLVDQSPSMQSTDPQTSPSEKIHWAEALGYLPQNARSAKPDLGRAAFTAVAGDFASLRPVSGTISAPATAQQESDHIADFTARLRNWSSELQSVRGTIAADASASNASATDARNAIDHILATAKSGSAAAKSAPTLHDADAAVDWSTIQTNLTLAANSLTQLSANTDKDFLATHADDSTVSTASARMTGITRSDLANLFMTGIDKRSAVADKSMTDLLKNYRVRMATFADNAQTTAAIDSSAFPDALKSALAPATDAHATNMAAGLQAISEQISPGQPAAILILTDGRHNLPGDPTEPARLLAARGVHVYGLLVGSHEVSPDAAVDQIDAPDWIFKGDTLHAAALIRLDGLAGQTAHVELRRDGVLLDTQAVAIRTNQETQRVDFTDKPPDSAAGYEYEVHVSEMRGEVNTQNNRATFRVAVKKDKLYALIIEDRPRWEFRYLAAYLSRDQRLKLQTMMINPATIAGVTSPRPVKASPTNPHLEAQILPETREEWQAFDLIILGDIPPDTLTNDQQQFIASAVRDKGATLITIAGQRHMPEQFANTPLAEILPITLVPQATPEIIARHTRFGFRPGLAPEGNASVLGQFGLSADTNANLWSDIPQWYWHSPFTQAKPSASVIWSIPPDPDAPPASANPLADIRKNALLSTIPIGLGRSLYLASDQSWRLRQVYGTNVHDRFWGQVLRWAVGSDLPAGGKFVRFGASQPTYAQGQPVTITARILREDLTPNTGLDFSAIARPSPLQHSEFSTQNSVEGRFIESPETPGYYHATLGGLPAGDNEISLQGAEVERLLNTDPTVTQKTVIIKILPQLDLEQRNMNTDPTLLARVAQAGGGFSLDANYADILASHIPAIEHTETTSEEIGFFTNPEATGIRLAHWTFLALFAILLTVEWILRKRAGLV